MDTFSAGELRTAATAGKLARMGTRREGADFQLFSADGWKSNGQAEGCHRTSGGSLITCAGLSRLLITSERCCDSGRLARAAGRNTFAVKAYTNVVREG